MKKVKQKLEEIPSYSEELGIDLKKEKGRSKWFLASILFGKRISADIAKDTYEGFEGSGITSPREILEAGWSKLVKVLDSGGYVRYDFSTARKLLRISGRLKEKYGSLEKMYKSAEDSEDLERKLLEFKGIGPTTVNIFLRELRSIWEKADPKVSTPAIDLAKKLGMERRHEIKPFESSLVRLHLEYCKVKQCQNCPVNDCCKEFRNQSAS